MSSTTGESEQTALLDLGDDTRSVGRARAFARCTLSKWKLAAALGEDAALVVSEMVANAVVHAGAPIRLLIRRLPSHVVVEVHDGDSRPPRRPPAGRLDESGRGLRLLDHLAERWGFQAAPSGKIVWCALAV